MSAKQYLKRIRLLDKQILTHLERKGQPTGGDNSGRSGARIGM